MPAGGVSPAWSVGAKESRWVRKGPGNVRSALLVSTRFVGMRDLEEELCGRVERGINMPFTAWDRSGGGQGGSAEARDDGLRLMVESGSSRPSQKGKLCMRLTCT